jgi:hypothetical protein
LSGLLKCFVPIGTGNPGRKAITEGSLKFFSETLVGIATQTEDTARVFVERLRRLYEGKRYFRFNVQQGLQANFPNNVDPNQQRTPYKSQI